MADIFVANGTHQHFHFNYRVPESTGFRTLEIPAGRQRQFPEDFNETQLAHVIAQLERYAVAVSDVNSIIHPLSLVYSVARKAIPSDKINAARERDEVARQEVSAQKTEESGIAQFPTDRRLAEVVRSTSLEVTQLDDRGEDPRRGGVAVEVSVSKRAGKKETSRLRGG